MLLPYSLAAFWGESTQTSTVNLFSLRKIPGAELLAVPIITKGIPLTEQNRD